MHIVCHLTSPIQSQIFHFLYYTEPQWDDVSSHNIMVKIIHSLFIFTTFFLNFALTTKCYFLGAFTTLGTTGSLCPFSCAHTTSWVLLNRCPYNFLLENFTGAFYPPKKLWNHVHIYLCWTIFKGYVIWRNVYIKNMNVVLHIINGAFVS